MAAKIMLIRHAEKPSEDGSVRGVDKSGKQDPDELSVRGWQRAGALIRFFAPPNGAFSHPVLATPDLIFACSPKGHVKSVRSENTVAPLAEFLNKSVDLRFQKDEQDKLVQAVAAAQGVVLIAWEHNAIPDIAAAIAGNDQTCPKECTGPGGALWARRQTRKKRVPKEWHDARFDLVWVLDRQPDSRWKFTEVPQAVLAGDRGATMESASIRTGAA